jgi:murein DD-endopeptidase MepM/ murein hydrolase activator NlpD
MRFSDLLCALNKPSLDDFHSWVFQPGMLFNAPNKWWGDRAQRDFPHEGVDFCLYKTLSGKTLQLSHHTNIPVIHDGIVKHIFPDYLGQAVIVEHDTLKSEKTTTISIYAHAIPMKQLHAGVCVKLGDVIATIADTRQSKTPIFPHLHYTLGMASTDIRYKGFAWNNMRDHDFVELLDPFDTISF